MKWEELRLVLHQIDVDTEFLYPSKPTQIQIPCPLSKWMHDSGGDKNPSMGINFGVPTQFTRFNCFTCKESGKLHELVSSYAALVRTENPVQSVALHALSNQLLEEDTPRLSLRFKSIDSLADPESKKEETKTVQVFNETILDGFEDPLRHALAASYLRSREVADLDVSTWGLLYDPRHRRIVFPVRGDKNILVGAVGRKIDGDGQKYYNYFNFPASQTLGGINLIKEERSAVIVVEGFFDILRIHKWAWDIKVDVVCTWKSVASKEQLEKIIGLDKYVQIWYDNDKAGRTGWLKTLETLKGKVSPMSLRRASLPIVDGISIDTGDLNKKQFLQVFNKTRRFIYEKAH